MSSSKTGVPGLRCIDGRYIGRYQFKGTRFERVLQDIFPDRQLNNKTEAKYAFDDFKVRVRKGEFTPAVAPLLRTKNVTLAEYLVEFRKQYCQVPRKGRPHAMIEFDAKGNCTRGSSDNCRLNILINSELGGENLCALSKAPRQIKEYFDELQAEEEFSGSTRNRYQALLKSAFNYAIETDEWGVDTNPFWKRKILTFADEAPRLRRVTADEEDIMLCIAEPLMTARIRVALSLGLRRGEILKCQLQHFDFKEWTLTLPRAIVKTSKSARIVPIQDEETRTFLTTRRFLGAESHPFGNDDGSYMPHFNGVWQRLLRNAFRVDDHTTLNIHFHDLRAECCSRLIENGKPIAIVADLLGDTIDTVEKHYKRLLSLDAKRAALR